MLAQIREDGAKVDVPSNEPWVVVAELGDCSSRNKDTDTNSQHEWDDIDTGLFGGMVPSTLVV